MSARVFLLSPAFCGGRRAAVLLNPRSALPIALRLRQNLLTLGEAFSFLSGLYFRGKLTYATAFDPEGEATYVITPTRGLLRPSLPVTARLLREFASVDVDAGNPRYRRPLDRDVAALASRVDAAARIILLGSVATGKYADVLAAHLGARLHFPSAFIGRGDMSRGGLLLRCVRAATELDYAVLDPGVRRRGPRPPKLGPVSTPN